MLRTYLLISIFDQEGIVFTTPAEGSPGRGSPTPPSGRFSALVVGVSLVVIEHAA